PWPRRSASSTPIWTWNGPASATGSPRPPPGGPETPRGVGPPLRRPPLVENAVHHGIEPSEHSGRLEIIIKDADTEALVTVEDNGIGADPGHVRRALSGMSSEEGIGLHNVDERLRP